jgi:hypothetical protein
MANIMNGPSQQRSVQQHQQPQHLFNYFENPYFGMNFQQQPIQTQQQQQQFAQPPAYQSQFANSLPPVLNNSENLPPPSSFDDLATLTNVASTITTQNLLRDLAMPSLDITNSTYTPNLFSFY